MVSQPRLCWEGARVFARVAASDDWRRCADQLGRTFGPAYRQALIDSRTRLQQMARPDAMMAEIGMWRVRLEDLVHTVPGAGVPLQALINDVSRRLATVPEW